MLKSRATPAFVLTALNFSRLSLYLCCCHLILHSIKRTISQDYTVFAQKWCIWKGLVGDMRCWTTQFLDPSFIFKLAFEVLQRSTLNSYQSSSPKGGQSWHLPTSNFHLSVSESSGYRVAVDVIGRRLRCFFIMPPLRDLSLILRKAHCNTRHRL
jgi:hypothetical protein